MFTVSAYCLISAYPSPHVTYATTNATTNTNTNTNMGIVPTAEVVHSSESMKVPPSVGTFVILIANEAHENWSDEKHKLITDKNAYYVPTNLIVPKGTGLLFLDADAPWDTPHPHTIELQDGAGNAVYSTGQLDYTNSSKPTVLQNPGTYEIVDKSYDTKEAKITVLENETSSGNLILGGFYTPTNQVENIEDNDGVSHPGSLQYYKEAFNKEGFDILSEYNFTYATCDYCPGGFWPDNKSGPPGRAGQAVTRAPPGPVGHRRHPGPGRGRRPRHLRRGVPGRARPRSRPGHRQGAGDGRADRPGDRARAPDRP